MQYAVFIEKCESNYSAYVPDLPGCVSVGDTLDEVKAAIREAITFHLEGMQGDGTPIPQPSTTADYVEEYSTLAVMAGLVPAIHAGA